MHKHHHITYLIEELGPGLLKLELKQLNTSKVVGVFFKSAIVK